MSTLSLTSLAGFWKWVCVSLGPPRDRRGKRFLAADRAGTPSERWPIGGKLDESGFMDALQSAIAAGDYEPLTEWIEENSEYCYNFKPDEGAGHVPEVVFSGILELLRQPDFLAAEDSHHILYFFEYNWSILTLEQREWLRVALREAYPKYHDWMARFKTSELFGDYFGDEKALEDLMAFMELERPELRELVPTGLDHLVRQTARPDLAARAMARLEEARADPDPNVRNEVEESFLRIWWWREDRAEREEQAAILGSMTSEKMWDEAVFSRVLQVATARENYLVLGDWVEQESERASEIVRSTVPAPMSEVVFSGILGLLQRPGFLDASHSWKIVPFFGRNWSALTSGQRERLGPVLREALPKFGDRRAGTAAAALLGERFPTRRR